MGEASEPAPSREPKPALARETLVVFAAERECERELEHCAGPERGNLYRRRSLRKKMPSLHKKMLPSGTTMPRMVMTDRGPDLY